MRCPDCNRFVGIEMAEPESDGFEVIECATGMEPDNAIKVLPSPPQSEFDGLRAMLRGSSKDSTSTCTITGTVRLVQTCAECGTELAEAEVEPEEEIEFQHQGECAGEVCIDDYSLENEDRYEGKGRGARHYYGARIMLALTCDTCGAHHEVELRAEKQASMFESLV